MKRKQLAKDSHRRSIVKSLVFRVVVIVSDTTVIFLITHKVEQTIGLTITTNLASMSLYYLYERVWNNINWGRA